MTTPPTPPTQPPLPGMPAVSGSGSASSSSALTPSTSAATTAAPAAYDWPQVPDPHTEQVKYQSALTGKPTPRDDTLSVSRLRALVTRYGSQTKAAKAIGVARSTFSTWISDPAKRIKPSVGSRAKITDLQKRLREEDAAMATYGRRAAKMRKRGAKLRIDGKGGPNTTSPDDAMRDRNIGISLTGDQAERLAELMATDQNAATDYINELYGEIYMGGGRTPMDWTWERVDTVSFDPR